MHCEHLLTFVLFLVLFRNMPRGKRKVQRLPATNPLPPPPPLPPSCPLQPPEAAEMYFPLDAQFPEDYCTWRSHRPTEKCVCRFCYRLLDVHRHFHRPKIMPKSKDSYQNKGLLDLSVAFCSLHCIDSYVAIMNEFQPKRYHRTMNKLMAWQRHKCTVTIFPIVDPWAHALQIPKDTPDSWSGKTHDQLYEHIRQGHLVEMLSPPFYIPK